MISWLRKQLASRRLLKVLVWIMVFCLGGFYLVIGLFRRFSRQPVTVALQVAGYSISRDELRRKVDEEIQRIGYIKQQFGSAADIVMQMYGMTGSPEDRARQSLVREKLLLSVADSLGIALSEEYISKRMADPMFIMRIAGDIVPHKFATKTSINYQALFSMLQRRGMSASCFESIIEERMKAELISDLVIAGLYIPQDALQEHYDRDRRARTFSIIKVPLDPYLKKAREAHVDDAILKKFFEDANKRNFAYWKPELRSGAIWSFTSPSDEFKKEVGRVILQHGAQFDEFVKKHGGIRQFYGPAELSRDRIAIKLFGLKPSGRAVITDAKQTFIVELQRIDPRVEQQFEAVREKVRADYDHFVASQELKRDLEALGKTHGAEREKMIARMHAQRSTTDRIVPSDRGAWQALGKQNLPINALMQLSRPGETETAIDARLGYLVEIESFDQLDKKDFDEKRFELGRALEAEEKARLEATLVASLKKNAKITEDKRSGFLK